MITLNEIQKVVQEICDDEFSSLCTKSTLRDWSNKGVISRIKVENGQDAYPEITIIEALTAIKLKNDYKLEEIIKAKNYLELKCNIHDKISNQSLVRYINFQKVFDDKKNVTKQALKKINDINKMWLLTNQLYLENKDKEIITDYFEECSRVKKEVKKFIEKIN